VRFTQKAGICSATIMDREELLHHIESVGPLGRADSRRLASLMLSACWPGGPEDRTERVALDWLRHWHPEPLAAELPACSCETGRCVLCN
jgi:hypothetical protein